ncbi:hypothetical protein [Wenzhouxiangella limi]|uniref:Uncharacterized protein n=1 Tax=Wenzhouxiangella limi TaxID=2707351 RepID=A0A845VA37_9GAMM|nr:hypothetical protein [Wenzhouxiangella limi]NDY96775.1 hypothetical protein [Wenzhouxiangella limi]
MSAVLYFRNLIVEPEKIPPFLKKSLHSIDREAAKKKASKKVATESGVKKAIRKKASKKKAGKKKRGKKKTAGAQVPSESLARLMAAIEELREAVVGYAVAKAEDQQATVAELRRSAQARIAEVEEAAVRSLRRFGL